MKTFARRIISVLLILAMVLAFTGCGAADSAAVLIPEDPEKEPGQYPFSSVTPDAIPRHFPKDYKLFGVNVGNMDAEGAKKALEAALHKYELKIKLNEDENTITGEQLQLTVSVKNITSFMNAVLKDEKKADPTEYEIIQFSKEALMSALEALPDANSTAKNAYLTYNAGKVAFVLNKEQKGYGVDIDALYQEAAKAVQSLASALEKKVEPTEITPRITIDSEEAKDALKKANAKLALNLKYVYTLSSGKSSTETLTGASLGKLLAVGSDGLSVIPDDDALVDYAAEMKSAHSLVGEKAMFRTSTGSKLDLGNTYSTGEYVDTDALMKDISKCIREDISGTRNVSYKIITSDDLEGNFGGNYVEVDLSSQHMWVYKNSECVVSSSTVSGCVANGNRTPTGLYYVSDLDTDCYLVGPTWESFVNYWIGFNGSIGLHDADGWRSSYGGEIYLFNGSHGCVNLPTWAAKGVYQNVSIGTPVIVYGGKTSVPTVNISGTSSYTVTNGCDPFTLDATPEYGLTPVYSSDNTAVATVSSSGVVTVKSYGTAHITVSIDTYACNKLTVTVTVQKSACDLGNHSWDSGVVTTEATCQHTGVRTYTCSKCKATKTETIPLADHSWDSGVVTTEATCEHEGVKTYTCTVCQTTKTEALPIVDHEYDDGSCIWCKRHQEDPE